jgi:hypothetical protein
MLVELDHSGFVLCPVADGLRVSRTPCPFPGRPRASRTPSRRVITGYFVSRTAYFVSRAPYFVSRTAYFVSRTAVSGHLHRSSDARSPALLLASVESSSCGSESTRLLRFAGTRRLVGMVCAW